MKFAIQSRTTRTLCTVGKRLRTFKTRDAADKAIKKLKGGRRAFGAVAAPHSKADLAYNTRVLAKAFSPTPIRESAGRELRRAA